MKTIHQSGMRPILCLAGLSLFCAACATTNVAVQLDTITDAATGDLECNPKQIQVEQFSGPHYQARGCQKKRNYVLKGLCSQQADCIALPESDVHGAKE